MKQSEIQNQRKDSSTRSRAADRQKPIYLVSWSTANGTIDTTPVRCRFEQKLLDDYNIADVTGQLFTIPRTGKYLITITFAGLIGLLSTTPYSTRITLETRINSIIPTTFPLKQIRDYYLGGFGYVIPMESSFTIPVQLVSGESLSFYIYFDTTISICNIYESTLQINLLR